MTNFGIFTTRAYTLFFFLIAFFPDLYAQETSNKKFDAVTGEPLNLTNVNSLNKAENQAAKNLTYNCSTVFWTVNNAGHIQQWNLNGNQITGGSTVEYCQGVSLAFCGPAGSLTFYSSYYPSTGIKKYDPALGWISIPTALPLLNNGGYHENQYFYYYYNSSIQDLYHFDGTTLTLIEHLPGPEGFSLADIAVDSLGRAWVFTGPTFSDINTLRIYDRNGLVTSYPFNFDASYCYGSFFINDQLYIGVGNNSLYYGHSLLPIIVNGTSVTLGTPIPFHNYSYTDMASCNNQSTLSTESNSYNSVMVYPNPAKEYLHVTNLEVTSAFKICNTLGQEVLNGTATPNQKIDIQKLACGTYYLKIEGLAVQKFVKI